MSVARREDGEVAREDPGLNASWPSYECDGGKNVEHRIGTGNEEAIESTAGQGF